MRNQRPGWTNKTRNTGWPTHGGRSQTNIVRHYLQAVSGSGERQSGRGWLPTSPVCPATQVGAGNAFLSHFSFIPIDRVTVKRVLQGWLILRLFYPLLDYSIGCCFNVFLLEQGRKLYSLSLDVDSMLTVNIVQHRCWFILSLLEFNFLFNSTRSLSVATYRFPIRSFPISHVYWKIWCPNIPNHRKSFEHFLISIQSQRRFNRVK